jgi:hypothetical protein
MTYTPNDPAWESTTYMTAARFNNMETQYAEGYTYFQGHNHNTRYYTKTQMETNFWYADNDGVGSGMDADMIYFAEGNKHYADFASASVPDGLVIMWEGAVETIPAGWQLADGTNGTNDLRNRWVIGAGSTYSVGANGGSNTNTSTDALTIATHTLTNAEIAAHTHTWSDTYSATRLYDTTPGGGFYTDVTGAAGTTGNAGSASPTAHCHSGSTVTTVAVENRPPSVALYYIQKI